MGGFGAAARPVAVGDVVELDVAHLADGPDALCSIGGYVVFVAFALPGERIRARIVSAGRKHGRAELLDVLRSSPDRLPPRCAHFGACGGCDFQMQAPEAQRTAATARVAKALAFALKRPPESLPVRPAVGAPTPWGQRTKVALMLEPDTRQWVTAGLFARRSQRVVPLYECPVTDSTALGLALRCVAQIRTRRIPIADPRTGAPGLRAIVARSTGPKTPPHLLLVGTEPDDGDIASMVEVAIAAGAGGLAYNVGPESGPFLLGRETRILSGPQRVTIEAAGRPYLVSPGAFFQTSTWGAAHLVEAVSARFAPPAGADALDLYCGGGLLTLPLASRCRRIVGIEGNPAAIEDARATARAWNTSNATFIAGRVEDELRAAARRLDVHTVVLDPPRDGCDPAVLRALTESVRPRRVIYVSCEPAALARDAAALAVGGYALVEAAPFEMFPHTHHVETVAVLEPAR
jgi:23S rRNA (uracil1939-C5)-methyltransferase